METTSALSRCNKQRSMNRKRNCSVGCSQSGLSHEGEQRNVNVSLKQNGPSCFVQPVDFASYREYRELSFVHLLNSNTKCTLVSALCDTSVCQRNALARNSPTVDVRMRCGVMIHDAMLSKVCRTRTCTSLQRWECEM